MHSRDISIETEAKSGRLDQACQRYGLGKGTMREVAEEAGAIIHVGKCLLINFTKVDAYLDALSGEE